MYKIAALLFVASCLADPVPFKCGEMPTELFNCMGNPTIIAKDIIQQCLEFTDPCERNECVYKKYGWLDGTVVNKAKVGEFYDTLLVEHPDWTTSVQKAKENCLTEDLAPYGSYPSCPAYDIMICSVTNVLKNLPSTQWSKAPECEHSLEFIRNCPYCPTDCFSKKFPEGTCTFCQH